MNAQTSQRRWAVLWVVIGLLVLALLCAVSSCRPRYRSHARVYITPFTNVVLKGIFLDQTFPAMRDIRVEQDEGTSMIGIAVDASTADAAPRAADESAQALCTALRQRYGLTAEVIDSGELPLRPYSPLHDELWPRLERILKRVGIRI